VEEIVDKLLNPVDDVWITPPLVHTPYLSAFLSTGLSTASTPFVHRFIHRVDTKNAYIEQLFTSKPYKLSTGNRFYPQILLITALSCCVAF
jgi:hypothetical protein